MALIHSRGTTTTTTNTVYYYYYYYYPSRGVLGYFKDVIGVGWGVSIIEALIIALITLNLLFSIWQTRIIGLTIKALDNNIANALPAILSEAVKELNISDIMQEPPNPIMQIIADAIGKNISAGPGPIVAKEITRSEDGKFS